MASNRNGKLVYFLDSIFCTLKQNLSLKWFYSYLINKLHFIYAELAVYLNQNMDPLEAITKKTGTMLPLATFTMDSLIRT